MIETADFLPGEHRHAIAQAAHFARTQGTREEDFAILPVDRTAPAGALVVIGYAADDYDDGDYLAVTSIRTDAGTAAFRSGLGEALLFLQGVFDTLETREDLRRFDAGQSIEVAAGALGVDAGELAGGPSARDPGYRIADDAKRTRLLYQERGEPSPIADSDRPALLVYLVHAARRRMATDVAARAYKPYAGSM